MRQARREMEQARGAVPVWIMPFSQVTSSFHPVRDRFDVLIVDEASQEGVLGLMPFYMAKKVIVVGDDEQVSFPRMVSSMVTKGRRTTGSSWKISNSVRRNYCMCGKMQTPVLP